MCLWSVGSLDGSPVRTAACNNSDKQQVRRVLCHGSNRNSSHSHLNLNDWSQLRKQFSLDLTGEDVLCCFSKHPDPIPLEIPV